MRYPSKPNIIIHSPTTKAGKLELAKRVSDTHATFVQQQISRLSCPSPQKEELLQAIINTKKEQQKAEHFE